jgi:hypothetical protein
MCPHTIFSRPLLSSLSYSLSHTHTHIHTHRPHLPSLAPVSSTYLHAKRND